MVLLRIRTRVGTWRVPDVDVSKSTFGDVLERLGKEYGMDASKATLHVRMGMPALDPGRKLSQERVRDGSMFFLEYDGDLTALSAPAAADSGGGGLKGKIRISEDGRVVRKTYEESRVGQSFRPGMGALRDMQKQWTWNDFMDLNKSLEFVLKRQTERTCSKATLDTSACIDFQAHLSSLAYRTARVAYVMGFSTEEKEVVGVALYEPPQENGEKECVLVGDDEEEKAVDMVSECLGMDQVGIVVSHPPRSTEEGMALSGPELLLAGQMQLAAARKAARDAGDTSTGPDGLPARAPTPFVTVRVTANDKGEAMFDVYQVSEQLLDMLERGALSVDASKPAHVHINPKFHAVVEAKPAEFVPVEFFLVPIPVAQERYFLHTSFPRAPRMERPLQPSDLKRLLTRAAADRKKTVEALRDFHALVYIAKQPFLAHELLKDLCDAVLDPDGAISEGHELMLRTFADE